MVSIDYSIIAGTYDVASFRAVKQVDGALLEIATKKGHVRVLDLACGTGSYIKAQSHFIENAEFVGIDMSVAMLSEARKKGIVTLVTADVDDGIPLTDCSVDYIVCRYGFHHFTNKMFVLQEVARCLRLHGVLNMLDVDPHSNSAWWVYTVFPEVAAIDRQRFMKSEELVTCLKSLGFEVAVSIDTGPEIMDKHTLLERLRTRDTSQLHMIDQKSYETKLREVEEWPEGKRIEGDYAFLSVKAQRNAPKCRPTSA